MYTAGQILEALKEGNHSNRPRSFDHGCVQAVLAFFIDTDGLNGEANGNMGTIATVLKYY
jgi:hypothetical protein